MGRELVAADDGLRVRDDESIDGVNANILDVDVADKCVQHLALSIAHIVLQFGE